MSSIPDSVYTDAHGAMFVQAGPGLETHYVGSCVEVDNLPNPRSTKSIIWCRDEYRRWKAVGHTDSPPGMPSFTVMSLLEKAANRLEQFIEEECPIIVHFANIRCGTKGVFLHWERLWTYEVIGFPDDVISNVMSIDGANRAERAISMEALPFRIDSRELNLGSQTTTEAQAANDIASCAPQCGGECGAATSPCEHLVAGHDAVGAGTANFLISTDGGTTWTAAAADPFAADENIITVECFPVAPVGTHRYYAVRDGDVAAALEAAYSDDGGATWTNVTIGATVAEAVTGPQSLFVLDAGHMWLATDDGRVFFCSDGGITWVEQESAVVASGAAALNAVHFLSANIGYAVGDTDVLIYTDDGGATWTAATATGGGNGLTTVQCFDAGERVIVGDDSGYIYQSFDGTTNWTTLTEPQHPGSGVGSVNCIEFYNDLCGLAVHDTAAPVGAVLHTTDGGYSWRTVAPAITNAGLNSVIMCSPTKGMACGEPSGALAVFVEING